MADYISREAAIENIRVAGCTDCGGSSDIICGFCDFENAVRLVNDIPAADVEPVRHGRWGCVYDYYTGVTDITCSHCKNTRTVDGKSCYFEDDYCPNCGAKMDLEDEK